jgi:hypothetical protein
VPRFDCLVGHPPRSINPDDPQWSMKLPADRRTAAGTPFPAALPVTYGDYFTAVCDYLSRHSISVPGLTPHSTLSLSQASSIHIHLAKHGAFYHPALVTATGGGTSRRLVVNVAISAAGRWQLPIEVESLLKLEHVFTENWVPRVYHAGNGSAPGHCPFPMFTGQWFDDFHEVHRTMAPGQAPQWSVWDIHQSPWRLTPGQVAAFFCQAMRILTAFFDPQTLSAILEWHHAAGDFVVRRHDNELQVRLITVRRYAPLFQTSSDEPLDFGLLMEALAAYWMRTSMWMRIDRIDGTGELVWADGQTLSPMWKGFRQGLKILTQRNDFPEAFPDVAGGFFAGHTTRDWLNLGEQIAARYPADSPEAILIKQHLDGHAAQTALAVQSKL